MFDCTRYWVVDVADRISYAFETSFNREETEEIDTTSQTVNPITIAWTEHQLVVYDLGTLQNKLFFFGPEFPAPQSTQLSQPQIRGFSRFVQKFDIAAVGTNGSLTLGGVTPEGVLQTSVRLVDTGSAVDLQNQLSPVTLYIRYPLLSIEIGDIILLNSGTAQDNLPTSFSTTGPLRVEDFYEVEGTAFQAIECVKVPDS